MPNFANEPAAKREIIRLIGILRPDALGYLGAVGASAIEDSGIEWGEILKTAPGAIRDMWLGYNQLQVQEQINEINLERVRQGQQPLNVNWDALRPGVNVGMTPETRTMIYWGVGLLVGGAVLFGATKR